MRDAIRPEPDRREDDYEAPRLERYGTFRELTLAGLGGPGDGVWVCGPCDDEEPQLPRS